MRRRALAAVLVLGVSLLVLGESLLLLGLPLLLSACTRSDPPNVVVLVVDTLRRDHLGMNGHSRDTSPVLDAFAADAVRFERAYSPAPWTRPAVASMFTGLYPSSHRTMALNNVLPPGIETLAEILAQRGYATAGIVSHVILSEQFGFAQGFEIWDESESGGHRHVSTPGVTALATEALDRLAADDRPFLLFVHYFDPHYNYVHHPEVGFAPRPVGSLSDDEDVEQLRERLDTLTGAEVGYLRALYDEEIRFTDEGIGRLLAHLDALGEQRTIVAITADHGEEFLERGWLGHTRTLYEELVAVPLLVRGLPGSLGHGHAVEEPVSLVSLLPTLLDLAGVPAGDRSFDGPSLGSFVRGSAHPVLGTVFAEVDFRGPVAKQARKQAAIGPRYKVIRDDRLGRTEIFDLASDPGERAPLDPAHAPEAVDALRTELWRFSTRERPALAPPEESETEIDPKLREQLRGLGYVEGESSGRH